MSTEAAVVTSDAPSQPNPAVFEPVASETKTDAERDYFKSRGEKADGLFSKAPEAKSIEAKATTEKSSVVADVGEDGEIIVEDGGTVRESDRHDERFLLTGT